MAKLRITEKGWGGFSDLLGTVKFKDGVSVDHVGVQDAERIGASMRVEYLDEPGISPNPAQRLMDVESSTLEALGHAPSKLRTRQERLDAEAAADKEAEVANEQTPENATQESPDENSPAGEKSTSPDENSAIGEKPTSGEKKPATRPECDYTQKSLSAVADENGIKGLREIAEKHGVKGASIATIISDLMKKKEKVELAAEKESDVTSSDSSES